MAGLYPTLDIKKGLIFDQNHKIIFDASKKNFGVPVLSKSFKGKVLFRNLKKNFFFKI